MTRRPDSRTARGKGPGPGPGLKPAAGVHASGLSVAAKSSLATSAVVAGSMIVFTLVLYNVVSSVLSDEIDEAGISAVSAMAVSDIEAWRPFHGTVMAGKEEAAVSAGQLTLPHGTDLKAFQARADFNRGRAERIAATAGTKILDAVVLDERQTKVINGRGAIRFDPRAPERKKGDVLIQEGIYSDASGRTQARTYTTAFRDAGGLVTGYAVLALSEQEISRTLGRLLTILGFLTVVFIGLAMLVSWVVAQRITRPVAILTEDIEMVAQGDLEHRTRAHSSDEIGVLARTFDRMTQNLLGAQDLQRKQAAQEHQMGIAREVQAALFPEKLPRIEGYECSAHARTSGEVTSEFYDVLSLADGSHLLTLVSASGAGVPGAMVVTMARSLLKALAPAEPSPAQLLRRVNQNLAPDLRRGMYVTVLLCRLEPAVARVTVANAGHHPLVVCFAGRTSAEPFHSDGIALGFDKGPVFDRTIRDAELAVARGDRLVLCSRSLFEGESDRREAAIYQLLARESAKNSEAFLPLVLHGLEELGGTQSAPAVTLLTLKRLP